MSAWNLRQIKMCSEERFAHKLDVTDVDFDGHQVIVSASKDETIKVMKLPYIQFELGRNNFFNISITYLICIHRFGVWRMM